MKNILLTIIIFLATIGVFAQTPTIVFPKNGQVINDSIIDFQWDEVPNATNYQLQIANDSLFQNIIYDTISNINHLSLSLNLSLNLKYIRFKSNNQIDFSPFNEFQCFIPRTIDSLVLWLAADTGVVKDVNGKISQWSDLSGQGNNAIQLVIASQPQFQDSAQGGFSSISFLNGDFYLKGSYNSFKPSNYRRTITSLTNNQYLSGFNVLFSNFQDGKNSVYSLEYQLRSNRLVYYHGNGISYNNLNFFTSTNGINIFNLMVDGSTAYAFKNDVLFNSKNLVYKSDTIANYMIGGKTSNGYSISHRFNGQVFEIIDYAKPITPSEIQLVNKYLLDKYTPPVNLGANILRRYGFCDTTLSTMYIYKSYVWNTGDTTRDISIAKEDTGWYWCDVPNLYGEIMRDSVYVYNLLEELNLVDTIICYGDSSYLSLPSTYTSALSGVEGYSYEWKNSMGVIVSTDSVLKTTLEDTYTLKISDALGCFITDAVNVMVDSFALEVSLGSDKSICSGEKIGLLSGQAQADSFLWNTGSIDSLLIVNAAGTYSLRTANALGCIARDTIDISIHGISPQVNFSADTVCFNDSTIFIDASLAQDASNLIKWTWDFNDGSQPLNLSTFQPFNHLLPDSGTYNVKLTVSTDSNCSNYSYKNIYIRPLPQANFITENTCENLNTEFINTTITTHGAISSYKWVLYDNNGPKDTLNTENAIYYYNTINNNRVDLFATSINNCIDSISQSIQIKGSPIANFTFNDVCDGDSVSFTDLSTSNGSNPLINREWVFNIEDTSNLTNPKHLFDSAHIYFTSLKIISQNTCWDSISKMVKVNAIPKVNFLSDSSCLNAITGFFDNSFVKDDTIKSYYWNFYSFGNSNLENPELIYTDTNLQPISLKITSGMNCVDSIIKTIKTHSLPITDFSSDKEYGAHPFDIKFDNKSQNAVSYYWDFDDASNSILDNPIHTFTDSLIYSVKLISTNIFTCSDSINKNIYGVYIPNDIAISSAPLIEQNDTLSFYCELINNGQQRIRDLKLELSYNDTLNIIEYWNGELLPENSFIYSFNSQIPNYRKDTINNYSIKITAFNNTEEYDTLNNTIDNSFYINAISDTINPISLVYPKDEQVISDDNINFQWNATAMSGLLSGVEAQPSFNLQLSTDSLFSNTIINVLNLIKASCFVNDLQLGEKYYWRVRSINDTNYLEWSETWYFNYFNPKGIDSLILWLAADTGVVKDINGKVSQWNDLSGNGNDATQLVIASQPEYQDSVLGVLPSLSFLNGNYYLKGSYNSFKPSNYRRTITSLTNNQYLSGFNVLFSNFQVGEKSIYSLEYQLRSNRLVYYHGDGANFKNLNFFTSTNGINIFNLMVDETNANGFKNNDLFNSLSLFYKSDTIANFIVGGNTSNGNTLSNPFNGDVFEIIDYAKPLDSSEIELVNKYLLDKYTPPINIGENIIRTYGFCDTTLSTEEVYDSYIWNTGDTIREISIAKEDTGWYWCDVPNLYGELMRDSLYVYDLLGKPNLIDTIICYGDFSNVSSSLSGVEGYSYEWKNSLEAIISTDSVLKTTIQDTYSLSISDFNGCFITDTVDITVDSFPVRASLGSDLSICTGERIGLVSGQLYADTFLWNTGSIDSLLVINTAGIYSLRTANGIGCIAKDTIEIAIHGISPEVGFISDSVCNTHALNFIDSSKTIDASSIIRWKWEFGDGDTSILQNPSHIYLDSGYYNVKLTTTTDSGCSNYALQNAFVIDLPHPDFITSNTCENHSTEFINSSVSIHDSINQWKWIFYDGGIAKDTLNIKNPNYYYNSYGNYRVDLIAESENNCKDSLSKIISIKESPVVDFSFADVCNGDSVSFIDLSTSTISNPLINREWIFNLEDTSNLINPKHLFDSAYVYRTSLKITSQNTCWDSISKFIKVNAIPKADFISDSSCLNAVTGFYDQSTVKDDTIKSYYWSFNSYGNSDFQNPELIYTDTIIQQIGLKVISGMNCVDSISKFIKTHSTPETYFSYDNEYGSHPFDVQFDNSSKNADSYYWDFNDGFNSVLENPLHTFTDSTIYDVKLISTNIFTCSDSATETIYGIYIPTDIAISSVPMIEENDTLNFYCSIINNGEQRVRDIKLELSYNDSLDIIEYWHGELLPGYSLVYDFNSRVSNYRKDTINSYSLKIIAINNTEEYDTINNIMDNSFHINAISNNTNVLSLIYPKDKQIIGDEEFEFKWNLMPSITGLCVVEGYNLQYSKDSLFLDSKVNVINLNEGSYFLENLELGTKYWWRVRSINDTIYSDWSDIWMFNYFNPKNIDSLVLWLAADTGVVKDINGKVSQWNDLSGNGNDATQLVIASQPEYQDSVLGVLPSLSFLNGNYYLLGNYNVVKPSNYRRTITSFSNSDNISGYNVLYSNFQDDEKSIYSLEYQLRSSRLVYYYGDGVNYTNLNFSTSTNGTNLFNLILEDSIASAYKKDVLFNSLSLLYESDTIANFMVGGNTSDGTSLSNPFNGQVFEIIDYAKPLDSTEIQLVNKYLLDKYTPPINLGAKIVRYYGFCDTTLSTEEMYESYIWNTGDTARQISIAKEDTGWYWCEVPNLYGELMRDSVYVYDLVGKPNLVDTLICYGDSSSIGVPISLQSSVYSPQSSVFSPQSSNYTYEWKNSLGQIVSTDSVLEIDLEDSYSLKITDTLGCFINDTVTINVDSFQLQASLGSDLSICTGNKIGLVSGQAEADSFLWNTASGDSLIEIFTAGEYSLIVRDTLNCVAKDTILIDIHGVTPMVSFSADTVCYKDSSLFVDASQSLDASNLVNWEWDFADGSLPLNLSTFQPFNHLLPDSGTYNVKLTVSTDSNCTNYIYKNIYIRPLPQPNFSPLISCENHEITFDNLTTHKDSLTSFYWDFGNGDTEQQTTTSPDPSGNNKQITYIYNQSGDYNTILGALDIYGCYDSIIKTISIKPTPEADFSNSVSCEGVDISFADNSNTESFLPINAWMWRFTDVDSSMDISPIHHYDTAGFYPVNLMVTSINGCWDTITKMVQLHAIPEANFSNDTACINSPVNFTELSTIEDGNINYYYWLQDEIAFSADQNPSFIFNDTLEHEVVLKVRTTALCEDSISQIVKVHPLPIAAFTTDRVYGLPPLTVGFINQSVNNNEQQTTNNLTYEWYFGDGGNSVDENPLHTYNDSAVFYPKLFAFNKFGCLDSAFGIIYAVYSAVDVSVSHIKAEINNGYISYSCIISNLGKQKLSDLELSAKYNSGLGISEQWQGELESGESMDYVFTSKSQIPNGDQIKYFCIEVQVTQITDQEDENQDNNSVCEDISTNYWVSKPYPNPASKEIGLDIIIPYSQTIEIELIDIKGNILRNTIFSGQKGLNNIKIKVNTLSSSNYQIRITTTEGTEVRSFIVVD